jgi:hypothetical protein
LFLVVAAVPLMAGSQEAEDPRFEVSGGVWLAQPSKLQADRDGTVDFKKDFGFGSAAQFAGRFTWKPRRRHRVGFEFLPYRNSGIRVLTGPIVFQNTTFAAGSTANARLRINQFTPGYRWDFVSRARGHVGVVAEAKLLQVRTEINGLASFYEPHAVVTRPVQLKNSRFAGLPLAGAEFGWQPIARCTRLKVSGILKGMSIPGYGRSVDARLIAGVAIGRRLGFDMGYNLYQGVRLDSAADRTGIDMSQRGLFTSLTAKW